MRSKHDRRPPCSKGRRATQDWGWDAVDAGGVALAAIQGLNQKVEERQHRLEEQLRSRDAEVAALKKNLADLQQRVAQLNRQTQLP